MSVSKTGVFQVRLSGRSRRDSESELPIPPVVFPPIVLLLRLLQEAPDPQGNFAWLEADGHLREMLVSSLRYQDIRREDRDLVCALLEAFSRGDLRLVRDETSGQRTLYKRIGTDSPVWRRLEERFPQASE